MQLILRMLAVQASLKEAEEAAAHKKESDEHPIESVSTEDGALVAAEPAVEEQQTSPEEVLVRSEEAATAAGSRTFINPQQGLTPGVPGKLFYNVSGGPLSQVWSSSYTCLGDRLVRNGALPTTCLGDRLVGGMQCSVQV